MCVKRAGIGVRVGALVAFLMVVGLACTATPALALSEGRVYEMVSPLYKGGYGTNVLSAAAPDGESVVYASQGAFAGASSSHAGNEYVSRRGASGWSTTSLMPPASILPGIDSPVPKDFSPNLEVSLSEGFPGSALGSASTGKLEDVFLLRSTDTADTPGNYSIAGTALKALAGGPLTASYLGASADFSHILFETSYPEPLLPLATETRAHQLYELVTSGEGAPGLRLVDLNNNGELINPNCQVALGTEISGGSRFNAIAADGAEIFFTTNANRAGGACDGFLGVANPLNPAIVFVRVGGERTLQVSVPVAADCAVGAPCASAAQARAVFDGANEAGSCAFFTTTQPLVTGDTDTGNDLYVARIGHAGESGSVCGPDTGGLAGAEVTSLVQVSHDPHAGEAAGVQGVVAISPDGSRVYFVARGMLSEGANAEGHVAVKGGDNLYVDEPGAGKAPVFVADLCTGPEESGEVSDSECPSSVSRGASGESDTGLWREGGVGRNGGGEEQTAGDGRFLLFSTYGRLSPGDTDTARDIYRYDAVTGLLDRVSVGEDGYDVNGNNSGFNAVIKGEEDRALALENAHLTFRAISEDGSRVVFTTAEPLSVDATNGLENAYEWHKEPGWPEGRVSLISTGHSTEKVNEVLMSASGRDVFFITSEGLVAGDTDGAPDVYDARLGGGFPEPASAPEPCSGDACQGPLTNPAPLLVPGSVSQAPGENASPPAAADTTKPKSAEKLGGRHRGKGKRRPAAREGRGRAGRSSSGRARR
jgi:hypothetical protein